MMVPVMMAVVMAMVVMPVMTVRLIMVVSCMRRRILVGVLVRHRCFPNRARSNRNVSPVSHWTLVRAGAPHDLATGSQWATSAGSTARAILL